MQLFLAVRSASGSVLFFIFGSEECEWECKFFFGQLEVRVRVGVQFFWQLRVRVRVGLQIF